MTEERKDPGITVAASIGDLEFQTSTEMPEEISRDEVMITINNVKEYFGKPGSATIFQDARQIVNMLRHCGFDVVYHGRLEDPSQYAGTYISHLMASLARPEDRREYETLKSAYDRFRGPILGEPKETADASGAS